MALTAAGLDSGTLSVDIVVIRDDPLGVLHEEVVPRAEMVRDPARVARLLEELTERYGLASIVVSSGYGVPLKKAQEATQGEIRAATFIHPEDEKRGLRILGLRRLMELVSSSRLPAWFTPGVVQLPTVPPWRKLNRIDLGTSDKVYSAAAALREEVEVHGTPLEKADFIVLEVGYAYTAALAVKSGAIVDGVGGTVAPLGYMGAGAWDAELAYLAAWLEPVFSKNRLFEGGAASLLGEDYPPPPPEEVARRAEQGEREAETVIEALAEAAAKAALQLLAVVEPGRIYLTGRWNRIPVFRELLEEKLSPAKRLGAETATLSEPARAKEAALGAALIASGLAGGRYKWIVDAMKLRESTGTIFDWIRIGRLAKEAKKQFGLESLGDATSARP